MTIYANYDIGDVVYVHCYRCYPSRNVKGEIVCILVYKKDNAYNIMYRVQYVVNDEVLQTDRWEGDLMEENNYSQLQA